MKKNLKKYKFSILITSGLILIFGIFVFKYKIEYNDMVVKVEKLIENLNNGILQKPYDDFNPQVPKMADAFSLFFSILSDRLRFLIPILPIFIILPSGYYFYAKLKSGIIRSEIIRKNYSEYIKEHLKISYKSMLIIPVFLVVSFLICLLVCGRLNVWDSNTNIFIYSYESLQSEYIKILPTFLIFYVINLTLLAGYYINVTLLFIKKNFPYLVSCIASFLVITGISVFLEVVVGKIILELGLGISGMNATFNAFCFWIPGDHSNIYIQFLIASTLFILSLILVILSYRNKEKVLIENEL